MFSPFEKVEIEQTIPRRFAECVRRHAEDVALRYDKQAVTYRALNAQSNQIANAILRRRGDSEETVALLLGQGISAVAGIIGLLKAGKAYVPIDPWMAPGLMEKLLETCGADIVLTDGMDGADLLAAGFCRDRLFLVDELAHDVPSSDPQLDFPPDRLAYVFFTSGTTGDPKGVADCPRNVLHNIMRYTNSLQICADDRLSLIQSWSFSGTVSSLFSALLNGATVCLYDLRRDGLNRLASWVREEQVSIFHSVPHIFEQLVAPGEDLTSLRIIRLEGDKASPHHIDLFKENFGEDCVLVNGLGATETGIARQFFVAHGSELPGGVVPVGYATEDMEVIVTDSDGREVATGEVGEIRVRSRYLAVGYWGRPDLTQERFCADPGDQGLRTYRTGDVGRLRQDGCLEYLGRADSEIRIRGQWVETEAIEAVLLRFPGIKRALVTGLESGVGRRSLAAYIIPDHSHGFSVSTIRRELGRIFPEQAIPIRFVPLDAFPVTASGKIDRAALPVPSTERPPLDVPFKKPRDVIEVHLKKIWESLLDIRPIGVRDDFFDLGGDSLLATEMLFMIEGFFGVTLTLNTLWLESTTVEELAEHLRRQAKSGFWKNPVPLQPHGTKRPLFCIHLEGGHLWPYRRIAQYFGHDRPIFGLPARGADGSEAADVTVEGMARNCVEMVRRQQPDGPYLIVGYSSGGIIAYETARQIAALGSKVGLLAVIDSPPQVNSITATIEFFRTSLVRWRPRLIQERLYQVVLDAVGLSHRRVFRTIGESHRWAVWRYRAGTYAGSMILVRCAPDRSSRLPDWGWNRLVEGSVEVHVVVAPDHLELMQDPYVRDIADLLRACADRADADDS